MGRGLPFRVVQSELSERPRVAARPRHGVVVALSREVPANPRPFDILQYGHSAAVRSLESSEVARHVGAPTTEQRRVGRRFQPHQHLFLPLQTVCLLFLSSGPRADPALHILKEAGPVRPRVSASMARGRPGAGQDRDPAASAVLDLTSLLADGIIRCTANSSASQRSLFHSVEKATSAKVAARGDSLEKVRGPPPSPRQVTWKER